MKKNPSPVKDIFLLFLLCVLIVCLIDVVSGGKNESDRTLSGAFSFPGFDAPFQTPVLFNTDTAGQRDPKPKKIIGRKFNWLDPGKNKKETVFHIPEAFLKKEIRKFGTTRRTENPLFLKKRGFKVIGKKRYFQFDKFRERIISMIDYKQVFQRNLRYFKELTGELIGSAALLPGKDPGYTYTFLSFVQHIDYRLPPQRYKGKFINSFFVPLVCLYEQYGDCDSKSILLAVFLCTAPGSKEKTAMVLVRGRGLSHALLAVKQQPLPGMTSLYDLKKGYYIVLETTKPGWAPGFINRRVTDTIKAGFFNFVELN